ncbi:MAG TPA: alpha/beta hydrolase [Rhodanobacteraceae bacterium]|nr:alpha/beta hydrolase [Rhodanobacteraceae bacterium]
MAEDQRAIVIARVKRRLKILGALLGLIVLALIVIYFAAPQWLMRAQVDWQARRAQVSEKSVQAGDTRWSYYEGGKGPTLLLLHGYEDSKEVWLPVAQYLTPNFRVIIPDLPGWGDSSRNPDANYGYTAQADRLRAFVEKLNLGAIALAGHSMGGGIAGVYASKYRQDIAALVLIDSAAATFKDNAFLREVNAGRNPFTIENHADFERGEKLGFENPPWLPPRFEDVLIEQARGDRAFDDRVFWQLLAPDQRDLLIRMLPEVTAPTLTIWCRQDKIIDIAAVNAIRSALTSAPKISVTEFNGCGHMAILERPKEIADAITHFVLMP